MFIPYCLNGFRKILILVGTLILTTPNLFGQKEEVTPTASPPPPSPICAIFVRNQTDSAFNKHLPFLREQLAARFTEQGFRIVTPDDVIRSMESARTEEMGREEDLIFAALASDATAISLARNLGVDFLLVAAIGSYNHSRRALALSGVDRIVDSRTLRLSYRLASTGLGESVAAGTVTARKNTSISERYVEVELDPLADLLNDASDRLAKRVAEQGGIAMIPSDIPATPSEATFTINCGIQDLSVPEVVRDTNGKYIITANSYQLDIFSVTVELNGMVIGNAPGEFTASPGLHRLRLTREGFHPWERSVFLRDGMHLDVALKLTDHELARWKERTSFMHELRRQAREADIEERLADAEVERVRALARQLEQSGYRVDIRSDTKSDIRVDADKLPDTIIMPTTSQNLWQILSQEKGVQE